MAFHDVLFPKAISYGSKGGPRFSTTVLTLASGKERRNQNWLDVRAEYDVSHGIKDRVDMAELRDFFYGRRGKAYSFRFYDHADNVILNQDIALGDGTTKLFQIVKTYSPAANPYVRKITKLVDGTLHGVSVADVVMVEYDWITPGTPAYITWFNALSAPAKLLAFMCNYATGELYFATAPANGALIDLAAVDFHVHVRFDTDLFDSVHDFWETESWESILLVEIKDAN
jgi:uncharacterized protein (TIGR02217 family)